MADTKISALAAYSTQHGDDLFAVVDVHDTSMGTGGTDKKATTYQVFGSPSATGQLVYWNGTSTGVPAGAASLMVGSSGQLNFAAIAAPGSPADGDEWLDSTGKCKTLRRSGLTVQVPGTVFVQTADNTQANTTSELSLIGTGVGTLTLPANFWVAGRTVRLRIMGTTTFASGSYRLKLKVGSVVLYDTVALSAGTTAGESLLIEALITCRSTGVGGSLIGVLLGLQWGGTTSARATYTGTTATAQTVDTTSSAAIDCTMTMGTAVAGNGWTTNMVTVESLN